jgi:NAD(P)-dependent dehydrogenase (short-subunit alcohol dehydrogenase family)
MPDRLAGKVAFLTGAAGSIGAATARLFAAEGARLVLADLDAEPLHALAAELGDDVAAAAVTDVTDSAQVRAGVALAVERFGGLDVVFANAGVFGTHALVADFPEDEFAHVINVNVLGVFHTAKHALAAMNDGGSLVITSSVVGLTSAPRIAAYATSKHAVIGLMRTAAKEVAERGIRVNSVHPGPVDNAFQHRIEMDATGADEQASSEIFDSMIPLGRHAAAEEVASTVLFLASDDSTFVTGATLSVDGGMSV